MFSKPTKEYLRKRNTDERNSRFEFSTPPNEITPNVTYKYADEYVSTMVPDTYEEEMEYDNDRY